MFLKFLLTAFIFTTTLFSFESTNIQFLYSNNFKGNAFIYDTVDGKKSTITFEHFRTFSYGDFFMFVDVMNGEKFDGIKQEVYSEIAPRFFLSLKLHIPISLWASSKISILRHS